MALRDNVALGKEAFHGKATRPEAQVLETRSQTHFGREHIVVAKVIYYLKFLQVTSYFVRSKVDSFEDVLLSNDELQVKDV